MELRGEEGWPRRYRRFMFQKETAATTPSTTSRLLSTMAMMLSGTSILRLWRRVAATGESRRQGVTDTGAQVGTSTRRDGALAHAHVGLQRQQVGVTEQRDGGQDDAERERPTLLGAVSVGDCGRA